MNQNVSDRVNIQYFIISLCACSFGPLLMHGLQSFSYFRYDFSLFAVNSLVSLVPFVIFVFYLFATSDLEHAGFGKLVVLIVLAFLPVPFIMFLVKMKYGYWMPYAFGAYDVAVIYSHIGFFSFFLPFIFLLIDFANRMEDETEIRCYKFLPFAVLVVSFIANWFMMPTGPAYYQGYKPSTQYYRTVLDKMNQGLIDSERTETWARAYGLHLAWPRQNVDPDCEYMYLLGKCLWPIVDPALARSPDKIACDPTKLENAPKFIQNPFPECPERILGMLNNFYGTDLKCHTLIIGRVIDSETGSGLDYVKVKIEEPQRLVEFTSNENGLFKLFVEKDGAVLIKFAKPGYFDRVEEVTLSDGFETKLEKPVMLESKSDLDEIGNWAESVSKSYVNRLLQEGFDSLRLSLTVRDSAMEEFPGSQKLQSILENSIASRLQGKPNIEIMPLDPKTRAIVGEFIKQFEIQGGHSAFLPESEVKSGQARFPEALLVVRMAGSDSSRQLTLVDTIDLEKRKYVNYLSFQKYLNVGAVQAFLEKNDDETWTVTQTGCGKTQPMAYRAATIMIDREFVRKYVIPWIESHSELEGTDLKDKIITSMSGFAPPGVQYTDAGDASYNKDADGWCVQVKGTLNKGFFEKWVVSIRSED